MTPTPGDPERVDPGQEQAREWRPGAAGPGVRAVPVAPPNWQPRSSVPVAPGTRVNPEPGPAQRTTGVPLPPELSPRKQQVSRPPVPPEDDIMAPPEVRASGRGGWAANGPRRAKLVLRRLDPWSVLKFSLVASICGVIVGVLVILVLFEVVSGLGVFDSVAKFLDTITDAQNGSSTRSYFTARVIVGGGAVLLGVGALLVTALATLGAFIYNLCASLTGGLEVTLSERS